LAFDMQTGLPAGPSTSSAQQALQWIGRPYTFLRECQARFGDTFTLDLGPQGHWVLFSRPESIRAIFTGDPQILHAGKGHAVLRGFLGPGSLLQLDGDRHLRERKLLLPAFHAARMPQYASVIRDVARNATHGWQPDQPVVMHEVMQRISLRVMLHAVFGLREGDLMRELEDNVLAFLGNSKFNLAFLGTMQKDLSGTAAWQTYWKTFERIDQLVLELVRARRCGDAADAADVLAMLLLARDEQDKGFSDTELRDELVTLLVTGFETTATALAWAFYWLHRHESELERLRAELTSSDATRSAEAAAKLPFVDAVCRETLRITPVIPLVARQVQSAFRVDDVEVPAGTTVAACIYLAHHRPQTYPDPDRFMPDRFLTREYTPYEWLPFGGGARRCLAMPLALMEMKVVLATILADWELQLEKPESVVPQRRSVSVGPSGGARMIVRARRNAAPTS
jgi:unspecific monooxygenase